MLGVRLEFTMEEFFAEGGVTTFTDRMAASLGIHAADLKVVAVYEGSTIIDFQVLSDIGAETPLNLAAVQETFEAVVSTMDTFMGSPVLNAVSGGAPIVTPNTVIDEASDILDIFDFGLDDGDDDESEEEPPEPEVVVEVRWEESDSPYAAASTTTGYIAILACIIVILLLVIVALSLYKKIVSNERVAKAMTETAKTEQDPDDGGHPLALQYAPDTAGMARTAGEGFGGSDFLGSAKRREDTRSEKEELGDSFAALKYGTTDRGKEGDALAGAPISGS